MSLGIPIINLRWSDDHIRFMMGIPIPIRRCLLHEYMPWSFCVCWCDGESHIVQFRLVITVQCKWYFMQHSSDKDWTQIRLWYHNWQHPISHSVWWAMGCQLKNDWTIHAPYISHPPHNIKQETKINILYMIDIYSALWYQYTVHIN